MTFDPGRVQDLFLAALEQETPADRRILLDRECAADDELRRRVEALLIAHDQPDSLLDRPFFAIGGIGDDGQTSDTDETLDHPLAPVNGALHGRTASPPTAEGPGSRIGPYKLLQLIGEGGMGSVYMAEQEQPVRRRVALKIIKPGMDSAQVIARFEAERQALALMDHQSIARVLDAGATETGRPFFVMELVHGVPITQYCDEAQLTPTERLELFIPVCQAIQHAHQKGVIHRDVKPSNVLVTLYDGKPVPKVIDFGIAKAIDQRLTERTMFTEFGAIVGTLEYMSPEQAEMSAIGVDTRSDVYSLGVLLYELMTGSTPLERARLHQVGYVEILRRIKEDDTPRPSKRLSDSGDALATISARRKTEPTKLSKSMRGELDWIVMKALEKDRSRRYDSARDFARDVQNYLDDEPVEARPPSVRYRMGKFVRRNKGLALASSLVLFALVAGIVGTSWGLIRAERALDAEAKRATGERLAKERETAERLKAQNAEKLARESEADTHAFSHFLVEDVLSAARPKGELGGLGVEVTVKQALVNATGRIAKRFQGRPRAEAVARDALGVTFQLAGDPIRAVEQLEQALALRQSVLGPDDRDTLETMNVLSGAYATAGMFEKAVAVGEETVKRTKARRGPDHPDTLTAQNALATAYSQAGMQDKAKSLLEETLPRQRARMGSDHAATVDTLSNLAVVYQRTDQRDLALPLLEESLTYRKTKLGLDHPATLDTLCNLGALDWSLGKFDRSVPLFEQAVAGRKRAQGIDHPATILAAFNLAVNYADAGRLDDAMACFDEWLPRARATLKPGQPPRDFGVSAAAMIFGRAHLWDKIEPLLREQAEVVKQARGADSIAYANRLTPLGANVLRQSKRSEAEKIFSEDLAIREKHDPDAWSTYLAKWYLGVAVLVNNDCARAETLLTEGYEGMKAREAQIPDSQKYRLAEARDQFVVLYVVWGKPDKADEWRARIKSAADGPVGRP
jgi:eukaryotic-like serine/threonine-protein kinase